MTHWMRVRTADWLSMPGLNENLRATGSYRFASALLAAVLEIVMADGPPPPAELRRLLTQIAGHHALRTAPAGQLDALLTGWTGQLLSDYGTVRRAIREAILAVAIEPGVKRLLVGCALQMVRSDHALSRSELDAASYLALTLDFTPAEIEKLFQALSIA